MKSLGDRPFGGGRFVYTIADKDEEPDLLADGLQQTEHPGSGGSLVSPCTQGKRIDLVANWCAMAPPGRALARATDVTAQLIGRPLSAIQAQQEIIPLWHR